MCPFHSILRKILDKTKVNKEFWSQWLWNFLPLVEKSSATLRCHQSIFSGIRNYLVKQMTNQSLFPKKHILRFPYQLMNKFYSYSFHCVISTYLCKLCISMLLCLFTKIPISKDIYHRDQIENCSFIPKTLNYFI